MYDLQPDLTNQLGVNEDDENVEEQRDTQNNIDKQGRDELESDDGNEKWCYCNRDESYDYIIGCDGKLYHPVVWFVSLAPNHGINS